MCVIYGASYSCSLVVGVLLDAEWFINKSLVLLYYIIHLFSVPHHTM